MSHTAILIPCYNEALTIEKVISDFQRYLPLATIYVYDNNSTDNTATLAASAGAIVKKVEPKGKGYVIREMFKDISADIYIMIDGDDTYDVSFSPQLVAYFTGQSLDMLVAARRAKSHSAYRFGHRLGNLFFTTMARWLFKTPLTDILSGYRVFSARFVQAFPAKSNAFEVETEMTIFASQQSMSIGELITPFHDRPSGSTSKLNTIIDGIKILKLMMLAFLYPQAQK